MPDFLLEIGTEEIPARMIAAAQEELAAPGWRSVEAGTIVGVRKADRI